MITITYFYEDASGTHAASLDVQGPIAARFTQFFLQLTGHRAYIL